MLKSQKQAWVSGIKGGPSSFVLKINTKRRKWFAAVSWLACAKSALVCANPAITSPLATNASSFPKNALMFCFANLPAEQQNSVYKRIVNLGASFTHGCMACDEKKEDAASNELTGDSFWFRRSPLTRFFEKANWKQKPRGTLNFFVVENDPALKPLGMLSASQLQRQGYSGVWHFEPQLESAQLLSQNELKQLFYGMHFPLLQEAQLVGGIQWSPGAYVRNTERHGIHIVAYDTAQPNTPFAQAFDYAVDGGRAEDVFRHYGASQYFEELDATNWRPSETREKAVKAVAEYLSRAKPSLVLALDSLFWDAIARTAASIKVHGTNSSALKFLIHVLERDKQLRLALNTERSQQINNAFFQVLERISKGEAGHAPTPVFMARMLDNAKGKFQERNYEPVIAALISWYISRISGQDIEMQLLKWLTKDRNNLAGNKDFQKWEMLSEPSFLPTQQEQQAAKRILARLSKSAPKDPAGLKNRAQHPITIQLLSRILIWDILRESSTLIRYFSENLNEINNEVRKITRKPDNNIYLINADDFFLNFAAYLKPATMHPHVDGATQMAKLIEEAVCKSTQEDPF